MGKIYLYMGKRDKKGIKILTIFPGNELPRARVSDIKCLHLPPTAENALLSTVHEHRFLWEVWIEGAENFNELKQKLEKRGYKNIPMHAEQIYSIKQASPDISTFKNKNQIMLERNSRKKLASSNAEFRNRKRTTISFNN